jgi:hypothetical protein
MAMLAALVTAVAQVDLQGLQLGPPQGRKIGFYEMWKRRVHTASPDLNGSFIGRGRFFSIPHTGSDFGPGLCLF